VKVPLRLISLFTVLVTMYRFKQNDSNSTSGGVGHRLLTEQVAQLSQRDRAAGCHWWVSFGQKWKTILCRQYKPRSIFNNCDVIGPKAIKLREITQNMDY